MKENVLKMRAKALAKPIVQDKTQADLEAVIFNLSKESYAIEVKYVKEVFPYKEITQLPCAPSYVIGLINVRRKILSVIDLRVFFSIPIEKSDHKKFLILEDGDLEFAVLTDAVEGVRKIPTSQIISSLPTLSGIRQEFLKGVTKQGIVFLDAQKLLTSEKIIVNETVEM